MNNNRKLKNASRPLRNRKIGKIDRLGFLGLYI